MTDETDEKRMERERLEALARVSVNGELPFEVKTCSTCKELRAIPKGRENCVTCRHPLTSSDLRRMNVPDEFWRVSYAEATPSVQGVLKNYLREFDEFISEGAGLYLWGPPGVGKTAAAVVLLKAARERFKTGYFIRASELRDAIRLQHDFDTDQSVMGRVREVDVLVLDSFGESDLKLPYLKLEELMDLVASRGQRRRVTLLTTTMPVTVVMKHGPFFETIGPYLVPTEVTGEDRRAKKMDLLAGKLHAKDESKPKARTKGGK